MSLTRPSLINNNVTRWTLPASTIPSLTATIGFGDSFALCHHGRTLYAVSLLYSRITTPTKSDHLVVVTTIPLDYDSITPLIPNISTATVAVKLGPTAIGFVHLACAPDQSAVYLNANLDSDLLRVDLVTAKAEAQALMLPKVLQQSDLTWHRQFAMSSSDLGPLLVTTARREGLSYDLVMLVNMSSWAVLGYHPCRRCHRPTTPTNSLAVAESEGAVRLLDSPYYDELRFFKTDGSLADWLSLDESVINQTWPSEIPRTYPPNVPLADWCSVPAPTSTFYPPVTTSTGEHSSTSTAGPTSSARNPTTSIPFTTSMATSTSSTPAYSSTSSIPITSSSTALTTVSSTSSILPGPHPLKSKNSTALLVAFSLTGALCFVLLVGWLRRCCRKRQLVDTLYSTSVRLDFEATSGVCILHPTYVVNRCRNT
jgi:hypothetical protein